MDAVVDVHEAPGLLAVAPDLDGMRAGELGLGHLAADRRRRLLPAAVVRPVRSVDVVVAGDPRRNAEVLTEVPAHPLAEELLPPVAVLGHRRIGVGLGERRDVGRGLPVGCVHAGRRREEEPLDVRFTGRHQHVGVDEDGQHAKTLVQLNKSHAAHVCCQVVNRLSAFQGFFARLL